MKKTHGIFHHTDVTHEFSKMRNSPRFNLKHLVLPPITLTMSAMMPLCKTATCASLEQFLDRLHNISAGFSPGNVTVNPNTKAVDASNFFNTFSVIDANRVKSK